MDREVAESTGSIGGGTLQPEEVNLTTPQGTKSPNSRLVMILVANKGQRLGAVAWNEDKCSVAFVVEPG